MSENYNARATIRAIQAKRTAHSVSKDEIKKCVAFLSTARDDSSFDPRTRLMAAKELINHDWQVFEHENPPVQKTDITSGGKPLPVPPSTITIKLV